jgi:hypothetical protein
MMHGSNKVENPGIRSEKLKFRNGFQEKSVRRAFYRAEAERPRA